MRIKIHRQNLVTGKTMALSRKKFSSWLADRQRADFGCHQVYFCLFSVFKSMPGRKVLYPSYSSEAKARKHKFKGNMGYKVSSKPTWAT